MLSAITNIMKQNTRLITEIQDAWRARELVFFVGAGLSTGAGLPTWYQLAQELAEQIGADMPPPQWATGDVLIQVVQDYVNKRGKGNLVRFLQDRLDSTGHPPTAVHQLLARSGVDLVFTANYDDLLEQAYRGAGISRRPVINDSDIPMMRRGGQAINVVKLYGDLEQPNTVVLAREDYERYFQSRPQIIDLFETELGRSTMLYLGWSHLDPHSNLLFGQMLHHYGQMMRTGYSVMFDVSESQQKELSRKGIHVIQLPSTGDRTQVLAGWLNTLFNSPESPTVGIANKPSTAAEEDIYAPTSPQLAPSLSCDELFDILNDHFTADEIRDLSFSLKIDYENLEGPKKASLARSLILYAEHRNIVATLVAEIRKERPELF